MLKADLTAANNADWSRAFTFQQSGGAPVDLTGSTLRLQVRRAAEHPEVLVAGVVTITNAAQGQFTVQLPVTQLRDVAPGTYHQDLVRTRADGLTETIWAGTLTVTGGITR